MMLWLSQKLLGWNIYTLPLTHIVSKFTIQQLEYAFIYAHHAAQPRWVRICDMPDDWRDGRRVDFINKHGVRYVDFIYRPRWKDWYNANRGELSIHNFTHVMLPIPVTKCIMEVD